jgi:hypothetical protein
MEPPALPWYRSPVYIAGITQLMSMLVVAAGLQTALPIEAINGYVEAVFVAIGVIAGIVGEIKRRKSAVQPLTLTKAGAELATAEASEPTIPTTELPK